MKDTENFLLDEDGIPIYKGDVVYMGNGNYPYTVEGFAVSQARSLHDFSPLGNEMASVKLSDGRAWPPELINHYWTYKTVGKKTKNGYCYKQKNPALQKFFWKNIRGKLRILKHKLIKQ